MIGTTIAHYRITEKLGEGGDGGGVKARDTKLGRMVALKVLPPGRIVSPQARERFEREANVVAGLNHPHICTLYDSELVEGMPLGGRLLTA